MAHRFLWLLRHAKTVTDPPEGGTDFDRVLAPRGRRDATALSQFIGSDGKQLGLRQVRLPQHALVSPAARTVATADLVVAPWSAQPEVVLPPELYGAEPEDVLALLRHVDDDVHTVMVVGHNPTAEALAKGLIAKSDKSGHLEAVRKGFPTCALGIYRFNLERWRDIESHSAKLTALFIPPFEK
jgi:phosphohistidine phosphatase